MAFGAQPPAPAPAGPAVAAPLARYLAGVVIAVVAVVSQYFLPSLVPAVDPVYHNLVGDLAIVYGIPIAAFAFLLGGGPLRHWASRMGLATWEGLRWYGLLSALAFLVVLVLTIVYLFVDPGALDLLNRPNPVLESAAPDPWFWIVFSFAIGACEEVIFRGWIFGYWLQRPGVPWLGPAIGTSALFAGVHLYYGFTYAAAAPLIFPDLFFLGLAFAAAVRASGGNLVIVAVLHGLNDAGAFLSLVNTGDALLLHYGVIGIGLLIALITWARHATARPHAPPLYAAPYPETAPFDPYALLRPQGPPPPPSAAPPPAPPPPAPPPPWGG